jgi:hypothetical protein
VRYGSAPAAEPTGRSQGSVRALSAMTAVFVVSHACRITRSVERQRAWDKREAGVSGTSGVPVPVSLHRALSLSCYVAKLFRRAASVALPAPDPGPDLQGFSPGQDLLLSPEPGTVRGETADHLVVAVGVAVDHEPRDVPRRRARPVHAKGRRPAGVQPRHYGLLTAALRCR